MKRQSKAKDSLPLPHLAQIVKRLKSGVSWEDLTLPSSESQRLREIARHMKNRETMAGSSGQFANTLSGAGVIALFSGPGGPGKTMAAKVLANDLDFTLYRIDLSRIVSKYIGETEKNLQKVFDAAEYGVAILFFDEADALFGKRSEVRDSHDRYANIEAGYLLQRLENYNGLIILATNSEGNIDPAFRRRIHFIVRFPIPRKKRIKLKKVKTIKK
jgi:SpoVK/Ycf46/Vps4 family AAA+-type ATPase